MVEDFERCYGAVLGTRRPLRRLVYVTAVT